MLLGISGLCESSGGECLWATTFCPLSRQRSECFLFLRRRRSRRCSAWRSAGVPNDSETGRRRNHRTNNTQKQEKRINNDGNGETRLFRLAGRRVTPPLARPTTAARHLPKQLPPSTTTLVRRRLPSPSPALASLSYPSCPGCWGSSTGPSPASVVRVRPFCCSGLGEARGGPGAAREQPGEERRRRRCAESTAAGVVLPDVAVPVGLPGAPGLDRETRSAPCTSTHGVQVGSRGGRSAVW